MKLIFGHSGFNRFVIKKFYPFSETFSEMETDFYKIVFRAKSPFKMEVIPAGYSIASAGLGYSSSLL